MQSASAKAGPRKSEDKRADDGGDKNKGKGRSTGKAAAALPPARASKNEDAGRSRGKSKGETAKFLTFKLDLIKTEMIRRANAAYRQTCGLDVRQLRVLRNICSHPGVTASDVAHQTLMEKTLVSKALAELFQRKLVRRTPHPGDGRNFQLWPTPAGLKLRDKADVLGVELEDAMLAPLSARERDALNRLVDKLMGMFRDEAVR